MIDVQYEESTKYGQGCGVAETGFPNFCRHKLCHSVTDRRLYAVIYSDLDAIRL